MGVRRGCSSASLYVGDARTVVNTKISGEQKFASQDMPITGASDGGRGPGPNLISTVQAQMPVIRTIRHQFSLLMRPPSLFFP
ncbi:hypothetical protein Tco_0928085 [Tanacetum coccineum]